MSRSDAPCVSRRLVVLCLRLEVTLTESLGGNGWAKRACYVLRESFRLEKDKYLSDAMRGTVRYRRVKMKSG